MSKDNIIPGYKGVMDLDLNLVDPKFRKAAALQHMKDIDLYKAEQYQLKPHLRFENTIERIEKLQKLESSILSAERDRLRKEKEEYYEKTLEIINKNKTKKSNKLNTS
jgi:hypothetical protein|tara:strand:- start:283 stop:606 length:324 start_codon:yes stop_codon:yes gene_type:complete